MATIWKLEIGQTVAQLKRRPSLTIVELLSDAEGNPQYKFDDGSVLDESKILLRE